jgi:hypothetical protein
MFFQIRLGQHADLIVVFGKQHSGHRSSPLSSPQARPFKVAGLGQSSMIEVRNLQAPGSAARA